MDHSHEWVAITPQAYFLSEGDKSQHLRLVAKRMVRRKQRGIDQRSKAPLVTFDVLPITLTEGTCCRIGTFPQALHTQVRCLRGLQASFEFYLSSNVVVN